MGLSKRTSENPKNIPLRKMTKGVETSSISTELTEKKPMAAAAVLATITTAISSVSNIWSSRNNLKAKQAEADNIAKQIDLEEAKGRSQALVEALEVKKEEINRLEAQDKANANLRAVIYVGAFAVISFVAYLFLGKKQQPKLNSQP